MNLHIPDRFIDPLHELARMPDDEFGKLAESLSDDGSLLRRLSADVASDASELIAVFASGLRGSADATGVSYADAARDVGSGLTELTVAEQALLGARVEELLETSAVQIHAKVMGLMTEAERGLEGVRIVTDVRPVFDDADASVLHGAVIMHTLRLSYRDFDGSHEIYISLSPSDIRNLVDIAQRALDKDAAGVKMLGRTGLDVYKTEGTF